MNTRTLKISLIVFLSIAIFVLLYIYFFSGDKLKSESVQTENSNVNFRDRFLHDIDSVIFSFGIKKNWIRDISGTGKGKDAGQAKDSMLISREVRIPPDLATIEMNYEITNYLRSVNLDVSVTEDPKSKNLLMNIFSMKDSIRKPAGNLNFIIVDSLKRNAAEVCIILDSLDLYSLDDVESVLKSTQAFSVILPLRNDKADYQSRIIEYRRDYLLKFSAGNEDDIEADFKSGMKESQWKAKVRSLCINFSKTSGVILLNNGADAELYNSIKEEFVKNNIPVFPESVLTYVRKSGDKIKTLFDKIISEAKGDKGSLIIDVNLTPVEFKTYDNEAYALKKSGYKFYDFKEIIKRMQRNK